MGTPCKKLIVYKTMNDTPTRTLADSYSFGEHKARMALFTYTVSRTASGDLHFRGTVRLVNIPGRIDHIVQQENPLKWVENDQL